MRRASRHRRRTRSRTHRPNRPARPACLGVNQADWVGGGPPLYAPGRKSPGYWQPTL